MALITPTATATVMRTNPNVTGPVGDHVGAYGAIGFVAQVEVAAAATAGSTYLFGYIPSGARFTIGNIYWDDLASTGSPTFDLGLAGENTTADPDAMNNGLVVSAAGTTRILLAIEDYGVPAWSIAGDTEDPGGLLQIYGTLADAAANTGGTIVLSFHYVVD